MCSTVLREEAAQRCPTNGLWADRVKIPVLSKEISAVIGAGKSMTLKHLLISPSTPVLFETRNLISSAVLPLTIPFTFRTLVSLFALSLIFNRPQLLCFD